MMPVIPASQRPRSVAIQHPYLPTCMANKRTGSERALSHRRSA